MNPEKDPAIVTELKNIISAVEAEKIDFKSSRRQGIGRMPLERHELPPKEVKKDRQEVKKLVRSVLINCKEKPFICAYDIKNQYA
ncbi:hypothetical protein WA026_006750 [Henosepilachna vigintioctopunctata]|uniref:Uncharacterized protein n=1 Tax=Henosepilachna vigintioctopunctata TaxID=420089 RepID=A0AAW1UF62_9CUCU